MQLALVIYPTAIDSLQYITSKQDHWKQKQIYQHMTYYKSLISGNNVEKLRHYCLILILWHLSWYYYYCIAKHNM